MKVFVATFERTQPEMKMPSPEEKRKSLTPNKVSVILDEKVIHDPFVRQRVSWINDKFEQYYKFTKKGQIAPMQHQLIMEDKIFFTRWLIFKLVVENFQRPGAAANLTMHEFLSGQTRKDPNNPGSECCVIAVRFHKTGEHKPIQISLSKNENAHFYNYLNIVRPVPHEDDENVSDLVLPSTSRKKKNRTEQTIAYSKKKQRKGESNVDFVKRREREENEEHVGSQKFSLDPAVVNHTTICHKTLEISFIKCFH